jgi:hypothetical protein
MLGFRLSEIIYVVARPFSFGMPSVAFTPAVSLIVMIEGHKSTRSRCSDASGPETSAA